MYELAGVVFYITHKMQGGVEVLNVIKQKLLRSSKHAFLLVF